MNVKIYNQPEYERVDDKDTYKFQRFQIYECSTLWHKYNAKARVLNLIGGHLLRFMIKHHMLVQAQHKVKTVEAHYTTIHMDRVMDIISRQRKNVMYAMGPHNLTVILGEDQMREVMDNPEMRYSSIFVNNPMHEMDGYPRTIMGMNVQFVPWFDGVVVMPTRIDGPVSGIPVRYPGDGPLQRPQRMGPNY